MKEVTAAVILKDNRVLIAQRAPGNFFTVKRLKVVNKFIVITGKLIRCHVVKKFVDIHSEPPRQN